MFGTRPAVLNSCSTWKAPNSCWWQPSLPSWSSFRHARVPAGWSSTPAPCVSERETTSSAPSSTTRTSSWSRSCLCIAREACPATIRTTATGGAGQITSTSTPWSLTETTACWGLQQPRRVQDGTSFPASLLPHQLWSSVDCENRRFASTVPKTSDCGMPKTCTATPKRITPEDHALTCTRKSFRNCFTLSLVFQFTTWNV